MPEFNWQTDVSPVITDECLECIEEVERRKPRMPAAAGICRTHDWPKETERRSITCGEFSIYQDYYEQCSKDSINFKDVTTGIDDWRDCANNMTCSRDCVRNYGLVDRRTPCDRGTTEARICVDYGIEHAFGPDACVRRKTNTDIKEYAGWMRDYCGVSNPPLSTKAPPFTGSRGPLKTSQLVSIIAPVVVVTILIILIAIGVVWKIQRRQRRRQRNQKDLNLTERNINSYGIEPNTRRVGAGGLLSDYDIHQCSEEIQTMVKQKLLSLSDIDVLEEIGRGQFGVIRKAKCYTNAEHTEHKVAAVKMIRNQEHGAGTEEEVKSFLREAYIMSQFDHVNVLNLMGIIWEAGDLPVVVVPFMGKGSLLDLIKKSELKFSERDLLNFVVQISAGLEYLESMKFVHRDIALRNCLVSDLYVVKISDFGLTRDIYDSRIYECNDVTEKRLPWKWLAPECIKQGSFTHKSDVWSFGVTIWELYTSGSSPYPAIGNLSVLQDCLEAGYRLSKPDKLFQQLYDLMRLMWNANPLNRPSFAELCSAIKLLTASEHPDTEYSYTMESAPAGATSPSLTSLTDYMLPVTKGTERDSKVYADSPLQPPTELDIY